MAQAPRSRGSARTTSSAKTCVVSLPASRWSTSSTSRRAISGKLDGKVALVTGGGGGMGGAQCRLFAQEGAAVCVADLFLDKGQKVVDEIKAAGGQAIAARLDVQKSPEWSEVVAATEAAFGPVSILCNNAGANFRVGFDEQTEEQWNLIVGTILTGSFL